MEVLFSADKKSAIEWEKSMMLQERLFKRIAENLNIESNNIRLDSHFREDLGADSLDLMELVLDLEEDFNIEVADHEVESIFYVKDCFQFVEQKIRELPGAEKPQDAEGLI